MRESMNFWNRMAKSYDRQVNRKYGETYRKTIELSGKYLDPGLTALDFACGTGITTTRLAGHVSRVIAIDTSSQMIEIARAKTADQGIHNVDYLVADIFDRRFDGLKVDVVFAFNILHFLSDGEKVLERIRQLLSPGGVFLSATDCLGEGRSLTTLLMSLLAKAGMVPYMKQYTIEKLEGDITSQSFQIVEARDLYDKPPNHFMAVRKVH